MMPGQFMIMMAGYNDEREYQERQQAKLLFLLRWPAAVAIANSTGKKTDPLDILYIPEFDDEIRELREQQKQEQQRKGKKAIEKYKRFEGV